MAKQLSFFVYVCDFEILYPFLLIGTTTVLNIHVLVSFAWCQRKFERRCVQNRDRRFISGQTFLIFKTIMILLIGNFYHKCVEFQGKNIVKEGQTRVMVLERHWVTGYNVQIRNIYVGFLLKFLQL